MVFTIKENTNTQSKAKHELNMNHMSEVQCFENYPPSGFFGINDLNDSEQTNFYITQRCYCD